MFVPRVLLTGKNRGAKPPVFLKWIAFGACLILTVWLFKTPFRWNVTRAQSANNSASFNGSTSYVRVPNSASLNITGAITLEAWIKYTANQAQQAIIERYGVSYSGNGGYALRLTAQGYILFGTLDDAAYGDSITGNSQVSTGQWHHVAGVFDGTQMRVYLDGTQDGSKSSTHAPVSGTSDLMIGISGGQAYVFPFNGLIDEARVSTGAIYTSNFTPSAHLTAGTSTKGLWKFDGQTTNDSSTYANNGTLNGGATYSTDVPSGPNNPPTVSLTDPQNNTTFSAGSNIVIDATASDSDGTIAKVDFYQGTTLLGTDTTAPYSFSWNNVSGGTYSLTAKATDNSGAATVSSAVTVHVVDAQSYHSLSLNGSTAYLNVLNSQSLNITGAITLEAWIKYTANGNQQQAIIERYGVSYSGNGGYALRLTAQGYILFGTLDDAAYGDSITSIHSVSTGQWHHVAGVFDGTQMRVYLDGTQDGSKSSTHAPVSGTSDLMIGISGGLVYVYPFNGLIDEARVSTGAIYTSNFTPSAHLTAGTSTKGLWKFDDQAPTDSSSNGNNGYSQGGAGYSTDVPTDSGSLPVPVAGGPYTGQAALAIQFNGGSSYAFAPCTPLAAYHWNFGDGAIASIAGPTHAYASAGTFTATLTVTDSCNKVASATASVMVNGSSNARLDPLNRTGGSGEDPLSCNFNWTLPLVSLPGRTGMDLGLTLSYNSLATWTKQGNSISFDDDRGFPSVGFRVGFPVIQPAFYNSQAGKYSYLLITPDGAHVELRQVGSSSLYQAVDSSYLLLDTSTNPMKLRSADGAQLSYVWSGVDYVCTGIKDRNGNLISINYDGLWRLDTIIDTLARTIKFNYDANGKLTSITQNWTINNQQQPHYWARFEYVSRSIQTNFSGLIVYGPSQQSRNIDLLSKVTLADNSYYKFSYSSWGQVYQITQYAFDSNPQYDTHPTAYTLYDLPQDATSAQTDCPRFTVRKVWAENWSDVNSNPHEALTTFAVPSSSTIPGTSLTGTLTQVTFPDQTSQKTYFGSSATSQPWQNGLPLLTESYDTASVKQRWVSTSYTQDDTTLAYPLNPRIIETNIYDPVGNRARTRVDYTTFNLGDGTSCRYPSDSYEYQADATTVLRRTHTDFQMSSTYTYLRILGLPSAKYVCDGSQGAVPCNDTSGASLFTKVTFQYDENGSIQGTDAPVQHDNTNYGSSFLAGRGNLSSVRRYDVINTGPYTTASTQYNTAGAVVKTTDAAGHYAQISYADQFSANGTTLDSGLPLTLAYPTTLTDPDLYTTKIRYNYDFGAPTWKQTPLPNVVNNQDGPQQKIQYDSIGRLQRVTNLVNNAYTRYEYGPNFLRSYATVNTVADEAYSLQVFDGVGRVIAKASNHPGSGGGYSAQLIVYDNMGRVMKQTNPTETGLEAVSLTTPLHPYTWLAAGDDCISGNCPSGNNWLYTQQTYDWKGRPLVTTNPDNTTKTASYTGCGCAGGEVVTLQDEGTLVNGQSQRRTQRIYSDVLGRQWKTEILNWDGSVYSTTTNSFNSRDQVTLARRWAGAENGGGAYQDSVLTYDGYGRLQTKHVPEQRDSSGNPTHTTWAYNSDDTVLTITDARGASATYGYNGRHLVTGITYSAPAGITATANATFGYDAAGNRTSMTDGLGSQSYSYNQLSQMTSETRTFNDPNNPAMNGVSKSLTYAYNLAGELTSITDPFNAQAGYNYDSAGRVSAVTGSGSATVPSYASNFQYRAWDAVKHLTFGSYGWGIDTTYDPRMQPTSFVFGPSGLPPFVSLTYQRNSDATMQYTHNVVDQRFDRSYTYDQAGRITQALSGPAASGGADNNNRPYLQYYSFDAWNNMTSRWGKHWSHNIGFSGTYTNNRMDGWTYDADGRNTVSNTVTSTYDAAGRLIQTVGPQRRTNPPLTLISGFNGDGTRIKKVEYGESYYSITSTVLGGAEITEIYGTANQFFGQKQKGHVYVNGSELAEEAPTGLSCMINEPGGSQLNGAQVDPLGDDVGDEDPYLPQDDPGFSYPHLGDVTDPGGGCVFGDFPVPCANQVRKTSGWSILASLLPHLSQFGLPINRSSTPPIFATPGSQITPRGVLTDIFSGTPIGSLFFPRAEELWKYITPTFFAPQNTNDEFTSQQLEQFKSCLSTMFKVYYRDHKYNRNGEAYFDGHSDRWPHFWSGSVGDFRVTTDQESYSSTALAYKIDPSGIGVVGGHNIVGYTDKRSPYVNAIANNAAMAGPVKGREFLGLWVYELGNALSVITNITPEIPADARDRYEIGGEAGAAFEDCVFGGRLNVNGSVTPPRH
jgi:YD repeat-containing protein